MSGFVADSLERRYNVLADCPPALVAQVVTTPFGALEDRVAGLLAWRAALLEGRLPEAGAWPGIDRSRAARAALGALNMARWCHQQPELVDLLLADLLRSFYAQNNVLSAEIAKQLAELEAMERAAALARRPKGSPTADPAEVKLPRRTLQRMQELAERAAGADPRLHAADAAVMASWQARAKLWAELAAVFDDLGALLGRGFDLSRGLLRQHGWLEVLKLRALLEKLPQLREIIQQLGRLQRAESGESVAETLLVPVRRVAEERRSVRTPLAPTETRGVERSDDLARMLPAEAALLSHPMLRLVWHARRAERALLCYQVEGLTVERVQIETEQLEAVEGKRPRPQRGPIVAVIDTSGSMHGLPERVAKAVVLEALRTAHAERRRCFVYAYSGPNQLIEHELSLTEAGISALMGFLTHTFGGGTDIEAMNTVVERLRQPDWEKADVVLVTDGEWRAGSKVVAAVAAAKTKGTRFHGVQVGAAGKTGLHQLCDPVHQFSEWAKLGGW